MIFFTCSDRLAFGIAYICLKAVKETANEQKSIINKKTFFTMKNFQLFLGIALMAVFMITSSPADAQTRRDRKDARKEARRLTKQDYKTMNLPLDRQLALYYAKVQELDEEGMPKYLQESSTAVGNSYSTAKMEAVNTAKDQRYYLQPSYDQTLGKD